MQIYLYCSYVFIIGGFSIFLILLSLLDSGSDSDLVLLLVSCFCYFDGLQHPVLAYGSQIHTMGDFLLPHIRVEHCRVV